MLQIELSALSAPELKRLLEVARSRNQTALAEQLVAELQARPTRAAEWRQAPSMNYMADLEFEPGPEPVRWRRGGVMVATAAIAAFVSAAVTWGLSMPATPGPQPAAVAAQTPPPPRATVALASLAPVPVAPPPDAAPMVSAEPRPDPPKRVAKARPPAARARARRCHDLPTPAQRLICGYPSLAAQDRQLRTAYDKALAAGADRRALDRGQAVWRSESEQVADHRALADRYARRLRELDAAAGRPPPPTAGPALDEPVF